jgi:uncharacterized protein
MRLDLTHIRQPETDFLRQYEPSAVAREDDDYRIAAPVSLKMTIYKDRDRFRLVGTVTTTLELACSRCLEPFTMPVDAAFDLRYLPHGASEQPQNEDDEASVEEDDLSTSFYRDDEIDLAVLLREQFYLALPMKPLCHEACKGLCPQCGINLNQGACQCGTTWHDPRLAGLKALITDRKHHDA